MPLNPFLYIKLVHPPLLVHVSADQPNQLFKVFLPPQTATLNAESPLVVVQLLSHV